jgi:hypothetical protein
MSAFTPHTIRLAALYFPILVGCAKRAQVMTYGELVAAAKARHPKSDVVVAATSASTGVKLDVIKAFCLKFKLPDLASLVVDDTQASEKHIATELQQQAFAYDWSQKLAVFDAYVIDETKHDTHFETKQDPKSDKKPARKSAAKSATKSSAVPSKKRKEDEAGAVLYAYYSAHKAELPPTITSHKRRLTELLMEGRDADEAFAIVAADL